MEYNNPNDPWMYDPYKGLDDDERMKAGCLQLASYLVMIFIGLLLCALFSGCTTTKYVPVIEHHTDTVRVVKVQHDSLVLKDSVYIHDKGDTILIEKWHTQYRDRWRTDTIYQSKTDSIPAPYPVEVIKEVPAQLTWWQQTRLHLANIVLWLLVVLAVIYVGKKHLARLVQD
jgi:hypothetical protein